MKTRIITGCCLAILALVVIFVLPVPLFVVVTALIMLIGAWEWSTLAGLKTVPLRIAYCVAIALCFLLVSHIQLIVVLIAASLFWLVSMYWIASYPKRQAVWSPILIRCLMGVLVIAPSWLAVNVIRASDHGSSILLLMFLLICSADIGAYFAGRAFGKHKLMPKVSPGKTWQGFFGGLLFSILVAMMSAIFLRLSFENWVIFLLVVVLINIFSVTGDLLESMVKRYNNVKDSGSIFPGHGGVMDRLDSLTAAAPIFLLGLMCHLF